jgi:hypothetical protein
MSETDKEKDHFTEQTFGIPNQKQLPSGLVHNGQQRQLYNFPMLQGGLMFAYRTLKMGSVLDTPERNRLYDELLRTLRVFIHRFSPQFKQVKGMWVNERG